VIILDTNVLIDYDRYHFDAGEAYAASILSRAELEFGVQAATSPEQIAKRTQRLNQLDARFDWLPMDKESTRSYGLVAAGTKATGAKVRGKDALIAAQAHRHGAGVMTLNADDFKSFAHLVTVLAPTPRLGIVD